MTVYSVFLFCLPNLHARWCSSFPASFLYYSFIQKYLLVYLSAFLDFVFKSLTITLQALPCEFQVLYFTFTLLKLILNVSVRSLKYSICGCDGWSWLSSRLGLKLTKRFLVYEVRRPTLNVIALSGVTHIIGGSSESSEHCLLSFPLPPHHTGKFTSPVYVLLRSHLPYCYDDYCYPLCYWNSMSATFKGIPKTSDYPGILQTINKWTGSADASILLCESLGNYPDCICEPN